jgi:hypothetical protein
MTVLIKRYANRKLYNTQTSRYITLKGISELIEAGDEVRVIDNETGEDITNVALSQILVSSRTCCTAGATCSMGRSGAAWTTPARASRSCSATCAGWSDPTTGTG